MKSMKNFPQSTEDLKTNLSPEELAYFEAIILRKREETQDELEYLQRQVEEIRSSDDDDASSLTHHMGDLGSREESLDLTYRLIQRNRKFINELNRALVRIENGTYGICRATGEPIEKGRLEFAPHTRYSIAAKKSGLDKRRAAFA
ncbi:TraR/DksA family transcriptional regulator [Rhodohalobacter halophilus]|uniref:TraR/DksA family transcriptional regulator n=1 Tax=Rhodohalobacter halophilus TaxID=1812810 RepID=UPI000A06F96B|nr:TraR/DksA C4-type zinc finger protein [Rhodohalobacter halophilus]